MSRRIPRIILIPVALLNVWAVALSCSTILEDRSDCPCILTVNTSEIPKVTGTPFPVESGNLAIDLISEEGSPVLVQKAVKDMETRGKDEYGTRIPRGIATICSSIGGTHYRSTSDNRAKVLAEGYEADSIFVHHSVVDCSGETAYDTLKVHKEWCTVTIHLAGGIPGKRYSFGINGKWNGFSTGAPAVPVEGSFRCETRQLSGNIFQARVPRQGDDSLILDFHEDDGMGMHKYRIASFPLGEIIYKTGFDWLRRDLYDVDITIDRSSMEIGIEVCPWYSGLNLGDMEL